MKLKNLFFSIFGALVFGISLSACGKDPRAGMIDYFNDDETVRLKNDYKTPDGKNRDFYVDGISEVKVHTYIDGDTSHFLMTGAENEGKSLIQSRYYGIDTPESTGDVEPYGVAAKDFTKKCLQEAKTIVITSESLDYEAPTYDSTGSRYTTMVWISNKANANYRDLRLLNLKIVQEGLSLVKALDKFPEFADAFNQAELQARKYKLNLFSGQKDPGFNDNEYVKTSLFAINNEVKRVVNGDIDTNGFDNVRVRVEGVVSGYSNNTLFLQEKRVNPDTGEMEYAGINVFTGMHPVDTDYTTVNTVLRLSALCVESEEFGFQLTAVHGGFPLVPMDDDPDNVEIVHYWNETPEDRKIKTFDITLENSKDRLDILNNAVRIGQTRNGKFEPEIFRVKDAHNPLNTSKNGGTLILESVSNKGKRVPFTVYIPFVCQFGGTDSPYYTKATDFVGHQFAFSGVYTIRKLKGDKGYAYSILPRTIQDITFIK